MEYQLIYAGSDPLPEWAAFVQAQLNALEVSPVVRWKRHRRCSVVCRKCGRQIGEVMDTDPAVVVTRRLLHSGEHPHALAAVAALGDRPGDDDPDGQLAYDHALVDADVLAGRRGRLSSTHSWWQPLDPPPGSGGVSWGQVELNCKCRTVTLSRSEFLSLVNGKSKAVL